MAALISGDSDFFNLINPKQVLQLDYLPDVGCLTPLTQRFKKRFASGLQILTVCPGDFAGT
jgi:hypothetical protein